MRTTASPHPIPPPGSGGAAPVQILRRLVRGSGIKADLFLASWQDRLIVVKDYGGRGRIGRWFGRIQVRREERIYRIVAGIEGVPPFLGVRGPESFAVAHVPGRPIDQFQTSDPALVARVLERLSRLIGEIHARGVAHVDLRRRDNVLADEEGRVHLIDFAGSIHFPAGSRRARWIFPWLRKVDESAFLKWKHRLAPDSMSPAEISRLNRMTLLRGFWFINRPGSHTS